MAFRFIVASLAFLVVAQQANASCHLPPAPCAYPPGLFLPPGLALPPIHHAPALALPSSIPCPPVQTKITQKPDINIPLPLPEEIPLGNFCSCQKYGITPKLLPCAPAPAPAQVVVAAPAPVAYAPAPVCLSAPVPAPGLSLSPCLLKTLLGQIAKPALPGLGCGCA